MHVCFALLKFWSLQPPTDPQTPRASLVFLLCSAPVSTPRLVSSCCRLSLSSRGAGGSVSPPHSRGGKISTDGRTGNVHLFAAIGHAHTEGLGGVLFYPREVPVITAGILISRVDVITQICSPCHCRCFLFTPFSCLFDCGGKWKRQLLLHSRCRVFGSIRTRTLNTWAV